MYEEYIPSLVKSLILNKIDSSYDKKSFIVQLGNGKCFEVNGLVASLINKIDGIRNLPTITTEFNIENNKNYSVNDVKKIIDKILRPKNMVADETEGGVKVQAQKKRSYVWFKFNFIKEKYVVAISNLLKYVFSPIGLSLVLVVSGVIQFIYYMFIMKPTYVDPDLFFSSKFIIMFLLFNLDNVFHELGHASSLKYYKQNPKNIGVGLYMFMIVFYADVTNVWNLKRKQRIVINIGGFVFELIILNLIFGLYFLTGDIVYLLTFLLIDIKIMFGINPFFRFDGYWIVNDLLGITNLRKKSNDLLKYFTQRITFRSVGLPGFWKNLNKKIKVSLVIYSILSLTFFTYVGYQLIILSYLFLLNINTQVYDFGSMIFNQFNFGSFITTGSFLFGKVMIILFTLYTIFRIMRYTLSLYKK